MKKALLSIIILSLMLVTFFQTIFSANAVSINKEDKEISSYTRKIYYFCTLRSDNAGGVAFLFPGYERGFGYGLTVKSAYGVLIQQARDFTGCLYINSDCYFDDWIRAYVFSFKGFFGNFNYEYGVTFKMDGVAKLLILHVPN